MWIFAVIFFVELKVLLLSALSSDKIHPLDLVVLLDGSVNAGEDNFKKELVFVRKLFNRFPIDKDGVHVGLGVISDDGLVAFNLKENLNNASVNAAIDKLTYPGGTSNLGKALTKIRSWIFQTSQRTSDVPKVLVSLLKGTTAEGFKAPSAQLQEDGVKIISIGIEADRIQTYTISSMVMFETLVEFLYDTDEKLNNIVNLINGAAGVHSGVLTDDLEEINGGRISVDKSQSDPNHRDSNLIGGIRINEETLRPLDPADITFLIDGSEGVGKEDFERELKFLGKFVKKFPISETTTRIALGTISDDGRIDFGFNQQQDAKTIEKSIRLTAYPAGKMYAGKALRKVQEEIFQKYTRSGVAQILVAIMKDRSLDDVKDIAADMRENRIKIIAIGTNKIHKDVDASSSISIFKDDVNGLLSDDKTRKILYQKILEQAENKT